MARDEAARIWATGRLEATAGVGPDAGDQALTPALARASSLLRALLELRPGIGFVVFDRDLRFLEVEVPRPLHTGRPPRDYVGKTAYEVYQPPQRDRMIAAYRSALEGRTEVFDVAFGDRILEGRVGPIRGDDGQVTLGFATAEDVTEHRSAQDALRRAPVEVEQHFRSVFKGMRRGFAYCQVLPEGPPPHDFVYVEVNQAFEDLTGLKGVAGKRVSEVVPGIREKDAWLLNLYSEVARTGQPREFERFVDALGQWFAVSVHSPASGYFVAVFDVTTKVKALERALRESEARLRHVMEAGVDGYWERDLQTGRVFHSAQMNSIVGLPEVDTDATDDAWRGRTHPDDMVRLAPRYVEVLAGRQEVVDDRFRVRREDGAWVWVHSRGKVVARDPHGRPTLLAGVVTDIQARQEAEEALRRSEELNRSMVTAMAEGVVQQDASGAIIACNPAAERILGLTVDQMAGRTSGDPRWRAVHEDGTPFPGETHPAMVTLRSGQASRDVVMGVHKPDGSLTWIEINAEPIRAPDGAVSAVVTTFADVTGRKEAEGRFRALADTAPVGIFESDAQGVNVYLNEAGLRIMGQSAAEAIGRGWHEAIHPDDRERVFREWYAAVEAQRPYTSEHRFLRPDGTVAVMRVYGDAIRGAEGTVTGFVGIMIDVTEQRRVEQQFAVSSRLTALGTLVAGVGHEINNPLAAMMAGEGFVLDLVKDLRGRLRSPTPPATGEVLENLDEMVEPLEDGLESGTRIARIVKDLAVFAGSRSAREVVAPRAVVEGGLRWLPASLGGAANVKLDDQGAPDVAGVTGQLSQVVLNLVTNACRAGQDGKRPTVTVRLATGATGSARIEVEDDGVGMTPEVMSRIFDPFFTTRPAGDPRGVGLGLSLCQTIVTAHGGTISVRSEPGKGSTFTVELPAAPADAAR